MHNDYLDLYRQYLNADHQHINYLNAFRAMATGISISKVVFNDPATIIIWSDGVKTVVKCGDRDQFDPEKGLAMAIAKRVLGNQGNYYNELKKWLPDKEEKEEKREHTKSITTICHSCIGCKHAHVKAADFPCNSCVKLSSYHPVGKTDYWEPMK